MVVLASGKNKTKKWVLKATTRFIARKGEESNFGKMYSMVMFI